MHPAEGFRQAKAAAQRAIALDPDLAEPHASLAFIRGIYEWQWDDAELLSITPSPSTQAMPQRITGWEPTTMPVLGRMDDANAEMSIARQLDPLSSIIQESSAYTLMLGGEYEAAIAGYREILTFDPSFYKAYTSMGRAYIQMGDYQAALAMLQKGRSLAGTSRIFWQLWVRPTRCSVTGRRARGSLLELERLAQVKYVPAVCFVVIHIGLGETGRAFDWLEEGCNRRESQVSKIRVHPLYEPLRGEPRLRRC